MNSLEQYLNGMKHQLLEDKFRVQQNAALPDGSTSELAASKLHFTWKGPMLISQHLFAKHIKEPTVQDVKQLFEAGLQFAKRSNRVPLLRGMNFSYMIVHCIITEYEEEISIPLSPPIPEINNLQASQPLSLLQYVISPPRSHFCIVEFPVLYNLSSQKAHYFQSNMAWGAWVYPIAQKIVGKYIGQ